MTSWSCGQWPWKMVDPTHSSTTNKMYTKLSGEIHVPVNNTLLQWTENIYMNNSVVKQQQ